MSAPLPVPTRTAGPGDLAAALDIWRQANTARGKPPDQERIARVHTKLADPQSLVLVAGCAGAPVGMALAEPGRDNDGTPLPDLCHISMLFVHPDYWGRRVGQHLIDAIAEHAARSGHTRLQLWTGTANRSAQRLYRRAGFEPTGHVKHLASGEPVIHLMRCIGNVAR